MRLAFFGTPDIAKTVLEALLEHREGEVKLVICQPDKPKGRGKKLEAPPVKQLAEEKGVPVTQPIKLKDGVLAEQMSALELDLAIVVAYGRILPKAVFEAPKQKTWNIHASLLPRHRGASPIQHAILGGDSETGVTLMELTEGLDEGPMLLKRSLPLNQNETTGSLTESLAALGSRALLEGIKLAQTEGLGSTPQNDEDATYAPIIKKQNGALDFKKPAAVLERQVRAFQPWPTAFIQTPKGPLKVLRASVAPAAAFEPGQVTELGQSLNIATQDGVLQIELLQPPGKRPMPASDYLRGAGRNIRIGEAL